MWALNVFTFIIHVNKACNLVPFLKSCEWRKGIALISYYNVSLYYIFVLIFSVIYSVIFLLKMFPLRFMHGMLCSTWKASLSTECKNVLFWDYYYGSIVGCYTKYWNYFWWIYIFVCYSSSSSKRVLFLFVFYTFCFVVCWTPGL